MLYVAVLCCSMKLSATILCLLLPTVTVFVCVSSTSGIWLRSFRIEIEIQHYQRRLWRTFNNRLCTVGINATRFSRTTHSIIIGIPLPTHSFTLGLNPSFSANPPYRSLSFFSFRIHYMDFPDCLLSVLSISVFLLFSFFYTFLVVGSVR